MTSTGAPGTRHAACAECLRRSWLLAQLSGPLDCNCRADGRLFDVLALGEQDLIDALAGRRRGELREGLERFRAGELPRSEGVVAICRHDACYPRALRVRGAPSTLFVAGPIQRLCELAAQPVVAVVGSGRATDYGIEIAGDLARGLAASAVAVVGTLGHAIDRAAQACTLEAGGAALAVVDSGLDTRSPARSRSLRVLSVREGTAVSELPCTYPPRRWSSCAAVRIVAALATVTVVVEAEDSVGGLTCARIAQSLGRTVAAVPGRVTSPASRATHALLREGAPLVSGPGDVLELLCDAERPPMPEDRLAQLEPRLRTVLERVGAGLDTPQSLIGNYSDAGELLQALSELELMGLLARGDGGRYVARTALDRPAVR